MGFLNELVSEFTHSGQQEKQQNGSSQASAGPPPVSPPWYAEWDARDNRWVFVNQQNGERTFTYPGPGYAQQQGSYGTTQGGYSNRGAYNQSVYNPMQGSYQQEEKKSGGGGNGWKYAAAGAAGVAGGALLMHEGDEIKEGWDRDKDRFENRVDEDRYRVENDVSNFPENAAGWTGEQVGRAEGFGDRVENRWDNAVEDVEDLPENATRWTGEKVQEVEDIPQDIDNRWGNAVDRVDDFGDRMDNAYDDGRDEQRYDDDRRDDW
ncbi:Nn.00g084750.m01.CDS01 [Neocucurbitaria sp. VM-36]